MDKLLAEAVTIDGRKEWYGRFCSETIVWKRSRCRRCQTNIPSVLQGKRRQAVSAVAGRCSSDSSSSGGGEDKVHWNSQTELRELREKVKWYERAEKKKGVQLQQASVEGRSEEDGKMEVDKKSIAKRSWINEEKGCTDMPSDIQDTLKESWQQTLQDIEQMRNDLVLGASRNAENVTKVAELTRQKEAVPKGFW